MPFDLWVVFKLIARAYQLFNCTGDTVRKEEGSSVSLQITAVCTMLVLLACILLSELLLLSALLLLSILLALLPGRISQLQSLTNLTNLSLVSQGLCLSPCTSNDIMEGHERLV